jgi:hypothetical protein
MKIDNTFYEELLTLLQRYLKIKGLFIMGSYATGTQHKSSDLDLLLISDDFNGMPQFKRKLLVKNIANTYFCLDPICLTCNEFNLLKETKRDFFLENMVLIKGGDIINERFSNKKY